MELPPQLRQHYFGHVIGPIGHHSVVNALGQAEETLTSHISNEMLFEHLFTGFQNRDLRDPSSAVNTFADGIRRAISFTSDRVYDQTKFPLTKAQVTMLRFLQEGKRPLWFVKDGEHHLKREGKFTVEINSVLRALQDIAFRTQGLEVKDLSDLIALANRPEIVDVMRSLMSGGPDFDRFIRSKPGEPIPFMFKYFQTTEQPIAFIDDNGMIRVNPLVQELSRKFRKLVNEGVEVESSNDGYLGNAAGCPLKGLTFLQHTPLLDEYKVGLTDEQVEILITGDNPTASPMKRDPNITEGSGNMFRIERDGISESLAMCVRRMYGALEAFERELEEQPDNAYLLGNVGLLIGRKFDPKNLRGSVDKSDRVIDLTNPSTAPVLADSFGRCPVAHG
jgi:hypothetical protein